MSENIRTNVMRLTHSSAAIPPPHDSSRPSTPHPHQVLSFMSLLMDQSPAASHHLTQPSLAQQPHMWSMPVSNLVASNGQFLSSYEQLPSRLLQATVPPPPPPPPAPPPPPQFPIPSGTLSQEQPAMPLFHVFSSGASQNEQQQQAQAMSYLLPPHQLQQLTAQQQQPHHPVGLPAPHYPSES